MELNYSRFVLTTPADRTIFEHIGAAYADLDAFEARLREKKIDVIHFAATRKQLAEIEASKQNAKAVGVLDKFHVTIRAMRIYLRAQLLMLLDEEAAWVPPQKSR